MKNLLVALGAALALSAGAVGAADAQAVEAKERHGDWNVVCSEDTTALFPCEAVINIKSPGEGGAEAGSDIARLSVVRLETPVTEGGITFNYSVEFFAPLYSYLLPGVQITIGDTDFKMPYEFCREQGCRAYDLVGEPILNAFKGGSKGTATFALRFPDKVVTANLDFSLDGFTAALDSIDNP